MSKTTEALKKVAVTLGYGSATSEYSGTTVADVLKEIAVKMECASSTDEIRTHGIADTLNYISSNYGSEENEPYNLTITKTNASVTVKKNNRTITAGNDKLYKGDKLKITASADNGYDLTTLTVNGTTFTNGSTITVSSSVAVVATGTESAQ